MLRNTITAAALAVGLEVRPDPEDIGVLRLRQDIPESLLQHMPGLGAFCSRCGRRLTVPGNCPARPTQRLVGLVVIRNETITYAEVGPRRFGSLGHVTVTLAAVLAAIAGLA